MAHVTPVDLEASREAAEEIKWLAGQTGFVANSMLTLSHRPEIAKAVLNLIRAVVRNPNATVDPALLWMVAHVTSLSNGCQYCSAHTFKNGADNGVPQEKLEALWEFETNPLFSDVERAALRIALTGGQCPASADPADMEILRRHYSTAQIVEICSVIALFGFNNRWNALMETELEESVVNFVNSSNYHGPDASA
ncbi:carboxymuconolactone decarboxylase family protein [Roseibium sp. MMSF_3544]|uniref:carboxymuconolactone decarboxylase family protein n=1 Tax=unclassified Roseibium TaxID=2629323 RepID=UPI00273E9AB4|nr:carboxymuconolactone decarboxylase family protein [Roseibium sp. MMSF_3544]